MRGEFDDELPWPFAGRVTVVMITQPYDEDRDFDESFDFSFKTRPAACQRVVDREFAPQAMGSHQFMSYEYLSWNDKEDEKYIVNDSIRFRITETFVEP